MKVILLFIILGYYQTHAGWRDYICCCCGRGDDKRPIDLDIYSRCTTSSVKVTKREEGYMVTYKIEPQNGYIVGRYTDNGNTIYRVKKGEKYKHLEVRCSNISDEPILVTLICSRGFFRRNKRYNYYKFKYGWKLMSDGFYEWILDMIRDGKEIDGEESVREYREFLRYISEEDGIILQPKVDLY